MLLSPKICSDYNVINLQKQAKSSKVAFDSLKKVSSIDVSPKNIKTNSAKFLPLLVVLMSCIGKNCLKNENKSIQQNKSLDSKDIFIKSKTSTPKTSIEANPSLEKFKLARYKYANLDEYFAKHVLKRKELHTRRMEVYGTTECLPEPREVKKSQYQAMFNIQNETGNYSIVKDKLRKGLALNKAEKRFFDATMEAMEPTTSKRTLWRSIDFFEGLEEQIRKGKFVEEFFSSTSSQYSDFYGYWPGEEIKPNGNGLEAIEGCMLKINIAENTPILDCNAIYKPSVGETQRTRMRGEVVLPPGEYIIKGYDSKLKILEVDFVPKI